MTKERRIFILSLVFFIIIFIYPGIFKDNVAQLVVLFFTFFIPALFPASFLLLIMLKTGVLQSLNKKHPRFIGIVISIFLSFGGTPLLLVFLNRIEKKSLENSYWRFISPSFSFIIYLFKPLLGKFALLLGMMMIIPPVIMQIAAPIFFTFTDDDKKISFWNTCMESGHEVIKSLYYLMLSIGVISLVYPVVQFIFPFETAMLIRGILEYTYGSIQLVKSLNTANVYCVLFVAEFNGIASFLAVKKSCPDLNLPAAFSKRIILSLVVLLPLVFLFKTFYNGFGNQGIDIGILGI